MFYFYLRLFCSIAALVVGLAPGPVGAKVGTYIQAGTGIQKRGWQHLDVEDGLLDPTIYHMLQSKAGPLWFATSAGVCRYDGDGFLHLSDVDGLAGNVVFCTFEDRRGDLWFGTENGVSRFDGTSFTTFTSADGLADDTVTFINEDRRGHLWFGTYAGVSRYDGTRFETFTAGQGLGGDRLWAIEVDHRGDLWFGTTGGLTHYDGETFKTYTRDDGLPHDWVRSIAEDRAGKLWIGTEKGIVQFDGRVFDHWTPEAGRPQNKIHCIVEDHEANMWFGTVDGAVRYDGRRFVEFTTENGLSHNEVYTIVQDTETYLWFGTAGGGVNRYAATQIQTYRTRDGLEDKLVWSLLQDRRGDLWINTQGGLNRFDGQSFHTIHRLDASAPEVDHPILEDRDGGLWVSQGTEGVLYYAEGRRRLALTADSGLPDNTVLSLHQDRRGNVWIGTRAGVCRYWQGEIEVLTAADGLADDSVFAILEDRQERMWFGTYAGVSRYEGRRFTNFTVADGLAHDKVNDLLQDRNGDVWIATWNGVSRYDGEAFHNLGPEDGLAHRHVWGLMEDARGELWFGTNGGVSHYDGAVFQSLYRQEGLAGNEVFDIHQARSGAVWFAANGGITRYRPSRQPPEALLLDIQGEERYGAVDRVSLSSSQPLLAFEFGVKGFRTRAKEMVYLYRLKGLEETWRQTRGQRVEYTDLPMGEYAFELKAVNRHLVYSDPLSVAVAVTPPYREVLWGFSLLLALAGMGMAISVAVKRRRERDQARWELMREMEEELQTAHELQMGLMPETAPQVPGYRLAGRCLPAKRVGGDFFQYFTLPDGRVAVSLADVTGHAMQAAIPVVMFSGILEIQMEADDSLIETFTKLNRSLHRILESRTFVCFQIGELDPQQRLLRLANAGCPYPYHYRAATGEVGEVELDALPLGATSASAYQVLDIPLDPGDRIVFCSDGIIEAQNARGEVFGYEQTAETIRRGCADGLSAGKLLDHLIEAVDAFAGESGHEDDQTVVILEVATTGNE